MNTCINHPTSLATGRCKRCAKPLCDACKMVSEVGVVCSQQCLDAIKTFQERVGDDVPRRKRHPLLGRGAVRGLMAVVILLAIAYAILCFHAGELLMPDDVLDMFAHWGRFLSTYF